MSIISEVKCARCDRKYSGVRSRCPYCGARRIGRGKYSDEADNSKGKMLIGILIMSILVIAVGVLLFTTPRPVEPDVPPSLEESPDALIGDEGEITSMDGTNPVSPPPSTPPIEDIDEPPETTAPKVNSVTITYANKEKTDITVKIGDGVVLRARIDPVGVEEEILWTSSNRNVFDVVPTNAEKTQAKVTATGKGAATLTVTVGGVEAECIVRGR